MTLSSKSQHKDFSVTMMAALGVTGLWFCLTWRYGFDLADEGYYWYGAQRVLRGEVPMRDFMSYDIGRYYWAASFMYLLGDDGVFGARFSAALYQATGTFLGVYISLLTLRQEGAVRWVFALLSACVLTVWVWPYYKSYDHGTSIIIVAVLVLMLKIAKPGAWLGAGLCIGVAAMIGRNHGVYGAFSATIIVAVLLIKAPSRREVLVLSSYFIFGVLIGFAPTLVMMLAIDGFAGAFVDSVVMLIRSGTTNINLPVPWPWSWSWSENLAKSGSLLTAVRLAFSMGFVFLLAFPLIGMLALGYRRFDLSDDWGKILLAAIAAAIPYAHYAFSRADAMHLSAGIFPALIGLQAAGGTMSRLRPLVLCLVLLATSVVAVSNTQPYLSAWLLNKTVLQADVGEQKLWMYPGSFNRLQWATKALSDQVRGVCNFLALPDMTSLYAIYRAKMPIWEIYPLSPKDAEFEAREIKRLESCVPELVLLSDHALDGKPEFRYSRMYPLIHEWLVSRYQLSNGGGKVTDTDLRAYLLKQ